MGDWDLYCALCATDTSVVSEEHIGTDNPAMLAIRRKHVLEIKKRVESGEEGPKPSSYICAEDHEDLDESVVDWDWDEEASAYDPALVSEESTDWQSDVRSLGLNVETNKAYLSGPSRHQDHGWVGIERGTDPNEPAWQNDESVHTYWTIDDGASVVFPMHQACLPILHQVLDVKAADVDQKALYEAMCLLSEMFQAHLTIDYGNIQGNWVDWTVVPGEEYVLALPQASSDARKAITDMATSNNVKQPPIPTIDMAARNVSDPFRLLPTEIIYLVASHLSFEDLRSCLTASLHVTNATDSSVFWKNMLYRETKRMGLDMDVVLRDVRTERLESLDYKRLWLWLEKVTRPVFGVDSPWLGAANRRRIWGACEQIADVYWVRRRAREGKSG